MSSKKTVRVIRVGHSLDAEAALVTLSEGKTRGAGLEAKGVGISKSRALGEPSNAVLCPWNLAVRALRCLTDKEGARLSHVFGCPSFQRTDGESLAKQP